MAFRWQHELPRWLLLLAMFGLAALAWNEAPERMPVRWSLTGQPERYGGKTEGLLAAAIVVLLLGTIVLIFNGYWIRRSDPHRLPPGQILLSGERRSD